MDNFDVLIAIYKNPRNKGKMDDATHTASDANPSCGDTVKIYLKVKDGRIIDASFEGIGCVISIASADVLSGYVVGKSLEDVERLDKEDLLEMLGIDLSKNPVRLKCALLPLLTLKKALK